jgi:hypothetical protein
MLGLLLNIENLHRDILQLHVDDVHSSTKTVHSAEPDLANNTSQASMSSATLKKQSMLLLDCIIDRYLNHTNYFFPDMFGLSSKGQIVLERLYTYSIPTTEHIERILVRLYGSLSYMIHRSSKTFHIKANVMNMLNLMQQEIITKKDVFERLLANIYTYYNEQIKGKLVQFDSGTLPIDYDVVRTIELVVILFQPYFQVHFLTRSYSRIVKRSLFSLIYYSL